MAQVAILMGSKSDLDVVRGAMKTLDAFGVSYEAHVMSAHRTPAQAMKFASEARANGFKVFICAAGMAAHLAGVVAAHTTLPVIGIPIASEPFNGIDSLLSTVQMPPGVPVATVDCGKAGAKNSALLAVEILALSSPELTQKLDAFRYEQTQSVIAADDELQSELRK